MGESGIAAEPVVVWDAFACAARIGADGRIENGHGYIRVRELPRRELSAREVDNAHPVRLRDRAEDALPDADPVGVETEPERSELCLDPAILFAHGERPHAL